MSRREAMPFSGSALKWFAVLIMLVDHIGACLLEVFVLNYYGVSPLAGRIDNLYFWLSLDSVLRGIGRAAFPIFCFLLVEGAVHTRSPRKYLLRLASFALISEIPFDLALHNQPFYWGTQNVFFTLLAGLLVIQAFQRSPGQEWRGMLALAVLGAAAELCGTDYGAIGVAVIAVMYLLRERFWAASVLSLILLVLLARIEIFSIPAFLILALYNGKRGRQPKYFFYVFYPVHLLILWAAGNFVLPALL
ncbi:TraX family protein [Lachnoclostridium sp. An138]|uniref:TraX family protein n=1 Tax=Lachnoclostridium sp. An138 TaxID=1965560 RepID=UPI001FA84703|nr:TraX family protein [Lachnoclostridium sp. An138]